MKSSPKDFASLHLSFLVGISLSFSSRTSSGGCSNDSTGDSIDIVKSGAILEENLALLHISFIGNIFSKNIASQDSKIVSTCISGTSDFTTKNL
jgi:hypothetical protein